MRGEEPAGGEAGRAAGRSRGATAGGTAAGEEGGEPCLRCGVGLDPRLMGCKGGHCPNCGHPYPHGDCSD